MASPKRLAIGIGSVLALLLAARIGIAFLSQPSDEQLIKEALAECARASKEGRPGGVQDFLSGNLTLNSQSVSGMSRQVADAIRKMKPDVTFAEVKPEVRGDSATMQTSAKIKFSLLNFSREANVSDVRITFAREQDRTWLVVPTAKWRITDIQVDVSQLPVGDFGL